MEIRIENTIALNEVERLKHILNKFFNTDFNIKVEGFYTYFKDN